MSETGFGCAINESGTLAICAPRGFIYRAVSYCPYCEVRTRHLVQAWVWYDTEIECSGCGHVWEGGYRKRQTNKARALRRHAFLERWNAASTRAEARRWLEAQLVDA
jgi:ribosomal protein L37AE/L43A